MFRQNISVYCKNEEVAAQVRAYAKQLNAGMKSKGTDDRPDSVKLPAWLTDLLNGGVFPAQEDCTREEAAIIYDPIINPLLLVYRQTKAPNVLAQISDLIKSKKI